MAGGAPAAAAEVVLTWQDRSENEAGFVVERSSAGLLWAEIGAVPADVTTFADAEIQVENTYSYRVQAYNGVGRSPFSNVATAFVPAPPRVNEPPTVGAISDQTILAGTSTSALVFMVADPDTALDDLAVAVHVSNPALVPATAIVVGGSGAARTVAVTPPPDQSGTATIVIEVSDGATSTTTSFRLVVQLATTPPGFTQVPVGARADAGRGLVLHAAATGEGPVLYQWFHDDVPVVGATGAEYAIPSAQRFHAGTYEVRVLSGGLAVRSEPVVVDVAPAPVEQSRLINLSTRVRCGVDDAVVIAGLVVDGAAAKRLLVRAVGPTLGAAPFGLVDALPDPRLSLKRWNGVSYDDFGGNADWSLAPDVAGLRAAMAGVSAFPLGDSSRDAALLADLAPGQYTVVVDDEQRRSGIALVEFYDADPGASPGLTNFSNRGLVASGEDVMIMGFVVADRGAMTLLLRAVGPRLAQAPFNLSGVLRDPVMELYGPDGAGGQIRYFGNDDWSDNPDQAYTAQVSALVQAFPLIEGERDAAMVATLQPGAYTVVVRGADGVGGVAIMELYTLR